MGKEPVRAYFLLSSKESKHSTLHIAVACENSRPSSLHATRAGSEEGRLFSQANIAVVGAVFSYRPISTVHDIVLS